MSVPFVVVDATTRTLTIDPNGVYKQRIDSVLAEFDRDAAVRQELAELMSKRLEGGHFPEGFKLRVSYEPPVSSSNCNCDVGGRKVYFLESNDVHVRVPASARPS